MIRLEKSSARPGLRRGLSDVLLYFALVVLGAFPGQVFLTWGTRMTLASNAALLTLTLPVCTAVMAIFFLGERMTAVRWLSFLLAVGGVVMCSARDFQGASFGLNNLAGNSLILLGVLGSAFYNSYGKKVLERYSPLEMVFYTYLIMVVLMAPFVLAEEGDVFRRVPEFTLRTWIGMALLAFFHNFLSMVLFLKALRELDATQAALSNYLITLLGLPIAAIWLGERLSPTAVVGGALVLGSTLLITLRGEAPVPSSAEAA
jgi:drug/metabolite transporter (DMT)-like permease